MLLLVRHGETDANRDGRYLGWADLALNDRGRAQAARLAALLPRPDVVISSPLRRARETADAFAASFTLDERWIELDYGPFDQQPIGDAPAGMVERWRDDPDFAPPGVETLSSLSGRVREACDELVPAAGSSVVIVVTHVSPVKAAVAWALSDSRSLAGRLFVEDAGVTRIDIADGSPVLRWFNRFGHEPGEHGEEAIGGLSPRG
jgi:broad specificity phosphatase PhoE